MIIFMLIIYTVAILAQDFPTNTVLENVGFTAF